MGMKKKQLLTYIALGVGGLLLLGIAAGLVHSVMLYREADQAYSRLRSRLGAFYDSDVFPSKDNVDIEKKNREQLEAWFDTLIAHLGKDNVNREDRSPSQFIGRLERTRSGLRQQAEQVRVRVPDVSANFAFGFERYAGTGMLPNPEDVPRLTEQLIMVTRLSRLIFQSEVSGIRSIQRDVFELATSEAAVPAPAPTPARRGTTAPSGRNVGRNRESPRVVRKREPGVLQEGDMFATYRFVLELDAREEAISDLLNRLASDSMFILVRSVTLNKTVPDMVPVVPVPGETAASAPPAAPSGGADLSFLFGGAAASGSTPQPSASASKTVLGPSHPVSGIEMEVPMQVRIELDVYKFRGDDEPQD